MLLAGFASCSARHPPLPLPLRGTPCQAAYKRRQLEENEARLMAASMEERVVIAAMRMELLDPLPYPKEALDMAQVRYARR